MMLPCKTVTVLGLASVSLFSVAQEIVTSGNQRAPHQVPGWFTRMASPESPGFYELESFVVSDDKRGYVYGVPARSSPRYVCKIEVIEGRVKWQFCEM